MLNITHYQRNANQNHYEVPFHASHGRDWGQEEKGTTEDAMAGWHHRLDGREFEQRKWQIEKLKGVQGALCGMNMWSMMQVSRGQSVQSPAGSEGLSILLKEKK